MYIFEFVYVYADHSDILSIKQIFRLLRNVLIATRDLRVACEHNGSVWKDVHVA
jgi:hypothetical protein